MKKLLFGALALTMLATACKKSDDNGTPANSFTIDGNSYTVVATNGVTIANNVVLVGGANGSNGASLTFTFGGSTTPAAGTYKVVASSSTPAANEVNFQAASTVGGSAAIYGSNASSVIATVTVNSGKISISMPDAPAAQSLGGSATVNVNANITQQ